jgi:hypothetical protein
MKKYLGIFILGPLVLLGGGCSEGLPEDEQVEYEDVEELIEEIDQDYQVRGSCNVIAEKSTCIDYIGSYWDTPEVKELNCQGVGLYSDNTCPYSTLGGCQTTPGTMVETVAWSYDYGGQPISVEEAGYQAMACNALGVAQWVTPDQIFLNPSPTSTE